MSLPDLDPPRNTPLLTRLRVRNYKSIALADVQLRALTILVGRNGSGKSNFLDALHLMSDGLQDSLSLAVTKRGGINEIRRRGIGEQDKISFRLEIAFPDRSLAIYVLEISSDPWAGGGIRREDLAILSESGSTLAYYEVRDGEVIRSSFENMPPASSDRLYLVHASGRPEFRPVYDFLAGMGFYNVDPHVIRRPQSPNGIGLLRGDGSNLANVVARLRKEQPEVMKRVESYLEAIVPDILEVETVVIPPYETLQFTQKLGPIPSTFYAGGMSDGTLRVLATLVAIAQFSITRSPVSLVGIEEPETALHPAAAGALMDALQEAALETQIIITSHSPDLLDQADLETDSLLSVLSENGVTQIAPINKASLSVIQDHLYTPGELLRMDQLDPDMDDFAQQEERPSDLREGEDVKA